MGLFDILKKKQPEQKKETKKSNRVYHFSIPFLNVPSGYNASKPLVNVQGYSNNHYEPFGEANLYPNLLEQYYYLSPIHTACIDFTVASIYSGYTIVNPEMYSGIERVKLASIEKKNRLRKLIKQVILNYKIHEQYFIEVDISNDKVPSLKVLDGGKVRINASKTVATISENWFTNTSTRTLPIWHDGCTETHFVWMYQNMKIGMSTYPLPCYNSVLNELIQDNDISYLRKEALKNGIFPSTLLQLTHEITTDTEKEAIQSMIMGEKRPEKIGNWMIMGVDGKDNFADLKQLNIATDLDELFKGTEDRIRIRIETAHRVTPALIGDATAGALSQNQQLQTEWVKFQYNVASVIREDIEEDLNYLFDIFFPGVTLKLNEGDFVEAMNILNKKNDIE